MRRILAFLGWLAIYAALAPGLTGAQEMSWDRTFGGTASEGISSIQLTLDGGYILAGWTGSYGAGGSDAWLIKTDAEGVKQWDRTFGGVDWDGAASVQPTLDGGYILAGWTSTGSVEYLFLIYTDLDGVKQWERTLGVVANDETA